MSSTSTRGAWLHPFLAAAYPVLALFAHNQDEVTLSILWAPLAVTLLAVAAFLGTVRLVLGDVPRAAVLTTVLAQLVFAYGHVFVPVLLPILQRHRWVLVAWAVVAIVSTLYIMTRRAIAPRVTLALNVMALVMCAIPALRVATYEVTQRSATRAALAQLRVDGDPLPVQTPLGYAPDIYYFIFDRYPNEQTLRTLFDFDNAPFLDFLRSRGFSVLSEARANYATTALSLASSLNMEYLDRVPELIGEDATDTSVTFGLVRNHRVQRLLRARGYTYVHYGSWWEPNRHSAYADVNVVYGFPFSEFTRELLETTVARQIFYRFVDFERMHHDQVLYKLETFPETVQVPGPKFVFAHFLVPHTPYVFDAKGNFPGHDGRTENEKFLAQVEFVNNRLMPLIDLILANAAQPPVIILQSDEGPHMEGEITGDRMTEHMITQKTYILNALYVPGVAPDAIDSQMTPVNSFRMVFNHCFGAEYPMLENKAYWYADPRRPYRSVDVTTVTY